MRFLVDDSSDARLVPFLSALGHDVRQARNYRVGLPDMEILAIAMNERRILITNDRDFGELVFSLGHPHAGASTFVSRRR